MTIKLDTLYRIDALIHTHHGRLVRAIDSQAEIAFVECVSDGQRITCRVDELRYVGPCQVVGQHKELDG